MSIRYGDLTPITAIGRILACLCALFGTATIGMLVSILVDRYQRVYTRKRYINEDVIDFDDYPEGNSDETHSRHSNQSVRRMNGATIENPGNRAKQEATLGKLNPVFDKDDNNDSSESPHAPLPSAAHPPSRKNSGVRFIVGYIDNEEVETFQEPRDRISSSMTEKPMGDNSMTVNLVWDVPLTDLASPDVECHFTSDTENSDDNEEFTEINTEEGDRNKTNVLKCFRRRSPAPDDHTTVLSTEVEVGRSSV